jgi:hypothetical protein
MGLPVGYGSLSSSSLGWNFDSTGLRYFTTSYRPAKKTRGGFALVCLGVRGSRAK